MPANIKSNGVDLDSIFLANTGTSYTYNTNLESNLNDLSTKYAPLNTSTFVAQGSQIENTGIKTSKIPYTVDSEYGLAAAILPLNGSQGSTNFTDFSSNQFTITSTRVSATATEYRFGGSSADFSLTDTNNPTFLQLGLSGYLSEPFYYFQAGYEKLNSFCVEFWVKDPRVDASNGHTAVFSLGRYLPSSEGYDGITLGYISNGNPRSIAPAWWFGRNQFIVGQIGPFPRSDQWNHIAFTYDAPTAKMRAYLNGRNPISDGPLYNDYFTAVASPPYYNYDVKIGDVGSQVRFARAPVYLNDLRVTIGSTKYNSNFVVPQYPNPTSPIYNYSNANVISSIILNFTGTNNSTVFVDESYFSKAITSHGNAKITTDQFKFGGSSGYFDQSSYIKWDPNQDFSFGTEDFTVEAWVYPIGSSITNPIRIFRMNSDTLSDYTFEIVDANTLKFFGASSPSITWTATIPLNTWAHIAWSRHAGVFKAFVNGTQCTVSSGSALNLVDIQNISYNSMPAGVQNSTLYQTSPCYVDNLIITKKVAKYTDNFAVPNTPSSFGPTDISGLFATAINNTAEEFPLGTSAKYSYCTVPVTGTTVTHSVTITFNSNQHLNDYFDNGGEIYIYPTSNKNSQSYNGYSSIEALLNNIVRLTISGANTVKCANAGTVVTPNIGGKNVGTTDTKLYENVYDNGVFYSDHNYSVFLRANSVNPTELILTTTLFIAYTNTTPFTDYYVSEIRYRYNSAIIKPTVSGVMTENISCGVVSYTPATDFTSNVVTGNAPLAVQFYDVSQLYPTSWAWNFTNGAETQSTQKNPIYTYTSPGLYDVKLTASNNVGGNTKIKAQYIEVTSSSNGTMKLTVDTSKESTFGKTIALPIYSSITRNGVAITTPYNVIIDWGDGSPVSTASYPGTTPVGVFSHTYTASGIFQITITGKLTQYGSSSGAYYDLIVSVDEWDNNLGIKYMDGAFNGAKNLVSVPNTLPTTVISTKFMFVDCYIFNDSNITQWNMTNVRDISGMFINATSFNQQIGSWDTSNVTDMSSLFTVNINSPGPTIFNQSIGSWDTSNVTDMSGMFNGNTAFNQNIGNWNVSNVTNMDLMFNAASSFNQNLTLWCVVNIPSLPSFFAGNGSGLQPSNFPVWGTCPNIVVELQKVNPGIVISNNGRTYFWQGNSGSSFGAAWIRYPIARVGKRYWEFRVDGNTNTNGYTIGLMSQTTWSSSQYPENPFTTGFYGVTNINYFGANTGLITNGSNIANSAYNFTSNDVIGIAVDFDSGKVWYRKNGTWIVGDPAAGINPTHTIPNGAFDPHISAYARNLNGYQLTGNFETANFAYTPPSGFSPLKS